MKTILGYALVVAAGLFAANMFKGGIRAWLKK
jgi:hypothetical protein